LSTNLQSNKVTAIGKFFLHECEFDYLLSPKLEDNSVPICMGIVPFEGKSKIPIKHPKNTTTMVVPYDATAAWLWQMSLCPFGGIFGMGLARALLKCRSPDSWVWTDHPQI
jgi:hypothetical protein